MSKGCKPRPMRVPRAEYEKNWDRAFGKSATDKELEERFGFFKDEYSPRIDRRSRAYKFARIIGENVGRRKAGK